MLKLGSVLIFWHFQPQIVLILIILLAQIWGILGCPNFINQALILVKLSTSRLRIVLKLFLFFWSFWASLFLQNCSYKKRVYFYPAKMPNEKLQICMIIFLFKSLQITNDEKLFIVWNKQGWNCSVQRNY